MCIRKAVEAIATSKTPKAKPKSSKSSATPLITIVNHAIPTYFDDCKFPYLSVQRHITFPMPTAWSSPAAWVSNRILITIISKWLSAIIIHYVPSIWASAYHRLNIKRADPRWEANIKSIQLKAELERKYKHRRVSKHSPKRLNQNSHTPCWERGVEIILVKPKMNDQKMNDQIVKPIKALQTDWPNERVLSRDLSQPHCIYQWKPRNAFWYFPNFAKVSLNRSQKCLTKRKMPATSNDNPGNRTDMSTSWQNKEDKSPELGHKCFMDFGKVETINANAKIGPMQVLNHPRLLLESSRAR